MQYQVIVLPPNLTNNNIVIEYAKNVDISGYRSAVQQLSSTYAIIKDF